MSRFLSPSLASLAPYTPGEQPLQKSLIKLNTNENPYEAGPAVYGVLAKALGWESQRVQDTLGGFRLYPDPTAKDLVETIAELEGCPKEMVTVGNGSDELLAFGFMAYGASDRPFLFPDITYGFYPVFAQVFRSSFRTVPLAEDFSINMEDYGEDEATILIANPNAPTGMALPRKDIQSHLQRHPNQLVVVDEAYVDFGGESCAPLVEDFDNLLVIKTLSKSRSLAGCRVGYALGNPALIEDLSRIRYSFNPYNLDRLAMAMGEAALLDRDTFEKNRNAIVETREWFREALVDRGFRVLPSKANFLLVQPPSLDGKAYWQGLRDGSILVRYFDQPRIRDFVRITIGNVEEMKAVLTVTDQILDQGGKNANS